MNNYIDTVLMFDELKEWLEEENIPLTEEDSEPNEMHNTISRFYPVPGGIIHTIPDIRRNYKTLAVDGLDRCINILDSLKSGSIEGYFLEMNSLRRLLY